MMLFGIFSIGDILFNFLPTKSAIFGIVPDVLAADAILIAISRELSVVVVVVADLLLFSKL